MKKFKTGLVALALVLGVSGAIASKISAAPKAFEERYDWESTELAPQNPSASLPNATVTEAQVEFGCSGGGAICAHGDNVNPSGGDADIRLNN